MDEARLNDLLAKFPSRHLLVVGDLFLDKYLSIDPAFSESSLETGLEAYQVVEIRHSPGAAGTVVANLRALDVQVSIVGVIGEDGQGFELRQDLLRLNVNLDGLMSAPDRFTPTYTKPMLLAREPDQPEEELNRLDIKNREILPGRYESAVEAHLQRLVPAVDGVIIADQVQERNCGVVTDKVRQSLVQLAGEYPGKPFIADSRLRIGEFDGLMVKPNIHEAQTAGQRLNLIEPASLVTGDRVRLAEICGSALFQKNQKPVFVTLGSQGILVVTAAGPQHIPGISVSGEIDIVGAGDSVMAGVAAGLTAGGSEKEAAFLGNLAASITIQQLGTTGTASRPQLRQQFKALNTPSDRGK